MMKKTGMEHQTGAWKIIPALIIFLLMVGIGTVSAQDIKGDNLQLIGILKSVDVQLSRMVVDVKTEGCSGERIFRFDPSRAYSFNPSATGETIEFFIDSPECTSRAVYEITPMEEE